jgi:hypothetical protein
MHFTIFTTNSGIPGIKINVQGFFTLGLFDPKH